MENAKTIRELSDAGTLLDGDFLAVSQPNIFNPITQQYGDTRRLTLAALSDFLNEKTNKSLVGKYCTFAYKPNAYQLAKMRLLELNYQIIFIGNYQELCDLMWCGAETNATALFWYKCDENGTRNVNGQYMRVADWRGMFGRVAGQNAVLRTDMNNPNSPPYDGKTVGSFNPDTFKSHIHYASYWGLSGGVEYLVLSVSGMYTINYFSHTEYTGGIETAPASLSEARYIQY